MLSHERQVQDVVDAHALVGVLGEEVGHQVAQLLAVARDGRRLLLHDLEHEAEQVVGVERVLEGAHFVQDATHRPQVTLEVVRLVLAHFGRHVVRRAHHGFRLLQRVVQHAGDAKVPKLDHVALAKEDVGRFQVPVQDALAVDVANPHE